MIRPPEEMSDTSQTDRQPGPYVQAGILRDRLVGYRKQTPLSQDNVRRQLGISLSTMHRTETGPTLPSAENMAAMLALYGVAEEVIAEMTQDIDRLTDLRSDVKRQYPDVPDSQLDYADHEAYASRIDLYQPRFLPDFMQPVGYNEVVRASLFPGKDRPDWLSDFNARRKEYLLGPSGPNIQIIMTEEAVVTNVGMSLASRRQRPTAIGEFINGLRSVNTVGQAQNGETIAPDKSPSVSVQILPFSYGLNQLSRYWKSVAWMHFADPEVKPRGYYAPPQEKEFTLVEAKAADFGRLFDEIAAALPEPGHTDDIVAESVSQFWQY